MGFPRTDSSGIRVGRGQCHDRLCLLLLSVYYCVLVPSISNRLAFAGILTPIVYVCILCLNRLAIEGLIFSSKYTNTWYSEFIPCAAFYLFSSTVSPITPRMMSRHMYDNTGAQYNVSRILATQGTLNEEAYKQYSPLFLSYASIRFLYSRY